MSKFAEVKSQFVQCGDVIVDPRTGFSARVEQVDFFSKSRSRHLHLSNGEKPLKLREGACVQMAISTNNAVFLAKE